MKTEKISELTIKRLSIYLRCLKELSDSQVVTTSSQALAEKFQLNSAQIRKDLTYFGQLVREVLVTMSMNFVSI